MATGKSRPYKEIVYSAPPLVVGALYGIVLLSCALLLAILYFSNQIVPDSENDHFSNWISFLGFVGTTASILLAAYTFMRSADNARRQSRKQHTITILLESRLSEEFRNMNEQRKSVFKPGSDIIHSDWKNAKDRKKRYPHSDLEEVEDRYKTADALMFMLNYYEFLALGIRTGDLDEDLLRGTMRGLMCSMVDDARDVIFHLQKESPSIYEHLRLLYERWRDPNRKRDGVLSERPIECCCD